MRPVINKVLNNNQYAVSPSIEDINRIYERELFRYRSDHYNRSFHIALAIGVFFVMLALYVTTLVESIIFAGIAVFSFYAAYSDKSSKRKSIEHLNKIRDGHFQVIYTYVTKICGYDNELHSVQCEVAHEDTGIWAVDYHNIKVGSPIIIAFDDKGWCCPYSEYTLGDKGLYESLYASGFCGTKWKVFRNSLFNKDSK